MKIKTALILLVLIASSVPAWNTYTQEYMCDIAIEEIYNSAIVANCLPKRSSKFLESFCKEVFTIKGAETYNDCINMIQDRNFMHPAEMPALLFNDSELHHDYSKCPAKPGPSLRRICGSKDDHPALDNAEMWFKMAEKADDVCLAVYDFCVGAHYYADSENPMNQLKNVDIDRCRNPLMNMVDERLMARDDNWQVYKRCGFTGFEFEQNIYIRDERITRIISELVARGQNMSEKTLTSATKAVFLANSIDFDLSFNLFNFLRTRNIDIIHSTADEFTKYQYEKHIIILGGQNAPEGVGGIVRTVLTSQEQNQLISSPDQTLVAEKTDIWKMGQTVWVLAGYDRFLTQNVSEDSKDMILGKIKQ